MIDKIEHPYISVVMGCYNNGATIKVAIESILQQSFSDFEFIIIDDCSTDATVNVVEEIADARIRLIKNASNQGLGYSLHLGMMLAKGKFIARMDADDIAMPRRFEKQVRFLEKNPAVLCVGTGARKIGELSLFTKIFSRNINPSCDYDHIKAWLLIGTPLLHPSVMFNAKRLHQLRLNYNPSYRKAQDYELWTRLIWEGQICNIPDKLLCYRYSAQQASSVSRSVQIENSKTMYRRMFRKLLNRDLTDKELESHILFATKSRLSSSEFDEVEHWINSLLPYIHKTQNFQTKAVIEIISRRWAVICRDSKRIPNRWYYYWKNRNYRRLSIQNFMCLIKP